MNESDFIEMFGETAILKGKARIVSTLHRHGPLGRRKLQNAAAHRHVSGDAFAASLTLLIDQGAVERDGDTFKLIAAPPLMKPTPAVPEWDKSGRSFRRS